MIMSENTRSDDSDEIDGSEEILFEMKTEKLKKVLDKYGKPK